jgi:excisionase family DNA binding protein
MTVTELAEFLKVNRCTVYRMLRSGTIPGIRIGKIWKFDRAAIDLWRLGLTAATGVELTQHPGDEGLRAKE